METQKDEVVAKKNKKFVVPVIISSIAVLAVVAAVIIVLTINSSGKDRKLQEQLDLGEKYISELDYEQAIVAYEMAIEIDPMSADAYLGLAAAYMSAGNYEKAIETLKLGYEKTGNEVMLTQMRIFEDAMALSGGANGQEDGMVSGDVHIETIIENEENEENEEIMQNHSEIVLENIVTDINTAEVGDIVIYGTYEQDNIIENDSEPLSEEELSRLWDTFYRVDESRSTKGTGLGLAIAKTIVELHGGKCYAKNTQRGVEFGFTLTS